MADKTYRLHMEIVRCHHCRTLGLALVDGWAENKDKTTKKEPMLIPSGGHRITGHKCAGQWDTVEVLEVNFSDFDLQNSEIAFAERGKLMASLRGRKKA